jgi:hypothetical protein
MRRTGRTTRLFHAIVVMGLGTASAAGCGGSVAVKSPSDASEDTAEDALSDSHLVFGDDATFNLPDAAGADANDAAPDAIPAAADAAVDHWVPWPPVIA